MKTQSVVALVLIVAMSSSLAVSSFPKKTKKCTNDQSSKLIKSVCAAENVLYKDLCVSMLTPFSCQAKNQTLRLTRIAVGISLSKSRNLITKVSNLISNSSAVVSCRKHIRDARDNAVDSLKQMKKLSCSDLGFQLSNVQTWLSSAMTSLNDCMDVTNAYVKGGDSDNKTVQTVDEVVINGTSYLNMVMSNSLAVVNIYADSVASVNTTCG